MEFKSWAIWSIFLMVFLLLPDDGTANQPSPSEHETITYEIEDGFLREFGKNWYKVNQIDEKTLIRVGIRGLIEAAGVTRQQGDDYIYNYNFGGKAILIIRAKKEQHEQFQASHLKLLSKPVRQMSEEEQERIRLKIDKETAKAKESPPLVSDPFAK